MELAARAPLGSDIGVACRPDECTPCDTVSRGRCPVCWDVDVIDHPFNMSSCKSCGHIFQTDLAATAVYDAAYARQYDDRPHNEMSRIRWEFIQRHLRLPQGSTVLDIGYGNGSFLRHALAEGMAIYGIDVHGEDFGIPEISYQTDITFDLVCFFDSLEHFGAFDQLLTLRAERAIVSVPHPPDFLLHDPRRWRHYKPGEHLHYFTPSSLGKLMRRWGLGKVAEGYPEDALRGKLRIGDRSYHNIYTSIYGRDN